jgi:hypothetical protein
MKKLITTVVVVALALVCTGAMALTLTINYGSGAGTGAKDDGGNYLVGDKIGMGATQRFDLWDLVEIYWAGNDDAIGGGDDVLLDQTVIGWGRFGAGTASGEWTKEFTTTELASVTTHNLVWIKPYDDIRANKGSAMWDESDLVPITAELGVNTVRVPNLVTDIPEPSIMLVSGLALLLLRKRK